MDIQEKISIHKKQANPSKEYTYIQHLFNALDVESKGVITKQILLDELTKAGIEHRDVRIKEIIQNLQPIATNQDIDIEAFSRIIQNNQLFIDKCLKGDLIISSFHEFKNEIEGIFNEIKNAEILGKVADYIPQLGRVDPNKLGLSICTIDGQICSFGDYEDPFCLQSTCKAINYCLALEEHGADKVHQHVGREPSGTVFNELALNNKGLPHNPMINSGAIMCCSLIKPSLNLADRFDYVMDKWSALCGDSRPGFNNAVYLSEKGTADRNFALGYFMRENKGFPEGTDLIEVLNFYFQCCAIELNTQQMAKVAATLANGGVCPFTSKRIFKAETVQNCLSLMSSCGMYDFSGEFAFQVGIPAKSGVSGAVMVVVPNVMGVVIWSPPLDKIGNSEKGIQFCKALVEKYNFHHYNHLNHYTSKKDPTQRKHKLQQYLSVALYWAASQGCLNEIKQLVAQGVDLNEADYDNRTAIHLASSEGQLEMVRYLILKGVNVNPVDRWGNTPLDDALYAKHHDVIELLKKNGASTSKKLKN